MTFEEVVRIHDDYYIHSTSPRVDDRTRVLKHGDTFVVLDRFGDVESFGAGELGIFHRDTRYLSKLVLRLGSLRPLLLSSMIDEDNSRFAADLMNPDFNRGGDVVSPRGSIHLFRSKVLWEASCHERLRIHNYGLAAADFVLSIELDADFADIFEVRGVRRPRRGVRLPTRVSGDTLELAYEGLDGRLRRTRIVFDPPPTRLDEGRADFDIQLAPRSERSQALVITCLHDGEPVSGNGNVRAPSRPRPNPAGFDEAAREVGDRLAHERTLEAKVTTSNAPFNDWLNRSLADLRMMQTDTAYGPYPYAGVPWFSTAFGRDGIITALECLWLKPAIARGVLSFLAATQAHEEIPEQDAEPGKVVHELRAGEMAALGEVPFGRYYGSVDATPLFVVLAGAYLERTGDRAFAEELWPHVERAIDWMDRYGDRDGDGFLEYDRRSERGLVHQGWKDSQHAVFHEDSTLADAPIALCEVQGYAYAARLAGAALAAALGHEPRARELTRQADTLRRRFEGAFWDERRSTYALALDGSKRPCRVVTSNAGHCLFAGIAGEPRARSVAATLMSEASFSGWGVRTVASTEPRYNPMSYHNGSIWPHDNALIAAGFARYGLKAEALKILEGLYDASLGFELHRLPELFCGFHRRAGETPTGYPVSCSPQAWAAGSVFLLLQSCLGLDVRGAEDRLVLTHPQLPDFIDEVSIRDLRVGTGTLDLMLTRMGGQVGIHVPRRTGRVTVVAVK